MRLLNRIKPIWFFAAFGVGLCICYVFTPSPTVVVKFPTPANAGKIVYRSEADESSCYSYKADRVQCTANAKEQPLPTVDAPR